MVLSIDLLIFDFDGTLADSADLLAELVNRALVDSGFASAPPERITSLIGLPLQQVLATVSGAPSASIEPAVRLYRRYANEPGAIARFRLFPGTIPTLEELARRGIALAIATSKTRATTLRVLEHCGIAHLFAQVIGGDSVARGKPHPDAVRVALAHAGCTATRAAVVGDTPFDIEMGKAAGVHTVAVTYGMHKRDELAALGPDWLIDDVRELVQAVNR